MASASCLTDADDTLGSAAISVLATNFEVAKGLFEGLVTRFSCSNRSEKDHIKS